MTNKKLLLPAIFGTTLLLCACSNEDGPDVPQRENMENNSLYELIQDFQNSGNSTRAESFTITSVEKVSYNPAEILGDSVSQKTSDATKPFELQTVTLDFGEKQGYAIVSDDERLNHVFLYVPEGCISDTTYIKPLKVLIDGYPATAANIIAHNKSKRTKAGESVISLVDEFVPYQWGQKQPFNNYTVYCTCSKCSSRGNHTPAGCVVTAVAQVIATLGKFNGTFYGTRDIDFSAMPKKGKNMTAVQKVQIGHFFQEIGLNCQVKYGCDGSGTSVIAAYNYLKDLGFSCSYAEGMIDHPKAIALLKQGIPILSAGTEKGENSGHMWVVDGVRIQNEKYSYHCNWGWDGSSDCWSTENDYEVTDNYNKIIYSKYSNNLKHIYINEKLK